MNCLAVYTGERTIAPVVAVVMNGGYQTVEAALEAVEADIPLLVFDGTGKAADLIAAAYKKPSVLPAL